MLWLRSQAALSVTKLARVERFSRYFENRVAIFHYKLNVRKHLEESKGLNLFLNFFTSYYQTIRAADG